jgi:hypothetical protein
MVDDPRLEQVARALCRAESERHPAESAADKLQLGIGPEGRWRQYRAEARTFLADFDAAAAATPSARQPMPKPDGPKII